MMQTPVESNDCRIEDAELIVVEDGLKPINGRDFFEALGISITQTLNSDEGSIIKNVTTQCLFKTRIANQLPKKITRTGRTKVQIVKSKFHKYFQNIKKVEECL